uniref:Uncharacterized protein n=1 Tax=Bursaphelenchus xylophilus TaxID=6326 RepID=A0A1I7S3L2_BURXY
MDLRLALEEVLRHWVDGFRLRRDWLIESMAQEAMVEWILTLGRLSISKGRRYGTNGGSHPRRDRILGTEVGLTEPVHRGMGVEDNKVRENVHKCRNKPESAMEGGDCRGCSTTGYRPKGQWKDALQEGNTVGKNSRYQGLSEIPTALKWLAGGDWHF